MHTFKHNTLINKLLLMQFYFFNIRPKLHYLNCVTLLVNMMPLKSVWERYWDSNYDSECVCVWQPRDATRFFCIKL